MSISKTDFPFVAVLQKIPNFREECKVFADLLFKIYLCFSSDFVKEHDFLLLDLH